MPNTQADTQKYYYAKTPTIVLSKTYNSDASSSFVEAIFGNLNIADGATTLNPTDLVCENVVLQFPNAKTNVFEPNKSDIEIELEKFSDKSKYKHAAPIKKRILALYDSGYVEPECEEISLGSLRYFFKFIESHLELKNPEVILTDQGNLKAEWELDRNNLVTIIFFYSDDIKYLVFTKNAKNNDKIDRHSGFTTFDTVFDTVTNYGVKHWLEDSE